VRPVCASIRMAETALMGGASTGQRELGAWGATIETALEGTGSDED